MVSTLGLVIGIQERIGIRGSRSHLVHRRGGQAAVAAARARATIAITVAPPEMTCTDKTASIPVLVANAAVIAAVFVIAPQIIATTSIIVIIIVIEVLVVVVTVTVGKVASEAGGTCDSR